MWRGTAAHAAGCRAGGRVVKNVYDPVLKGNQC